MANIQNDKYYTSESLAIYYVVRTKQVIRSHNITEYIFHREN